MKTICQITIFVLLFSSCTKSKFNQNSLYLGSIYSKEFSGSVGLVLDKNYKVLSGYVIGNGGHPFPINKISSDSKTTTFDCPIGVLGKCFSCTFEFTLIEFDTHEYLGAKLKIISMGGEPTMNLLLVKTNITKALQ